MTSKMNMPKIILLLLIGGVASTIVFLQILPYAAAYSPTMYNAQFLREFMGANIIIWLLRVEYFITPLLPAFLICIPAGFIMREFKLWYVIIYSIGSLGFIAITDLYYGETISSITLVFVSIDFFGLVLWGGVGLWLGTFLFRKKYPQPNKSFNKIGAKDAPPG